MVDVAEKLAYFQAVTGLEDPDLCTEILQAHNWDLELAISSFTSPDPNPNPNPATEDAASSSSTTTTVTDASRGTSVLAAAPGLAWRVVTLPISVVSGSLGLISGAVGLGLWAAGGILAYSLGAVGLGGARGDGAEPLVAVSASAREAMEFLSAFNREYGPTRPDFVPEGFMDALQRSRREFKLLFVYLHSPDHPDTPVFCERTLCSEVVAAFINENFVAWGGSIQASEGFKISNSLKASRFPFCAVVMPATNQSTALIEQLEGPTSPEEMLRILQKVLEESAPVLVAARTETEERMHNMQLREEQDAAYRAALEADQLRIYLLLALAHLLYDCHVLYSISCHDGLWSAKENNFISLVFFSPFPTLFQARERERREEQERVEREAAEAERKRKEEDEARERSVQEAAEREAAVARMRQEKSQSLGAEPEKGPDVTQILVRFPTGERKDRRFYNTSTIQSLYDYVDSLGCLEDQYYSLVSNFPRTVYGTEKLALSLKEAGLHPQASLFVEPN